MNVNRVQNHTGPIYLYKENSKTFFKCVTQNKEKSV